MKKWEYLVTNSACRLEKLGEDGWELIQVVPSGKSLFGGTYDERWVFKRPILPR
jgi:hypothetical protein